MQYNQNSNLYSKSGYCMPFEEREGRVEILRNYGEQPDGSFNHGIDFKTKNFLIAAVADGVVCGAMNDRKSAVLMLQHGDYQVEYRLKNRFAQVDQQVKAGMVVGMAGDSLHIRVKYLDEEIPPIEFLTMIYGNIKMLQQTGKLENPEFETIEMDVVTDYDDEREEIERLMLRHYPSYLQALSTGDYLLPTQTEMSLRNIFSWASVRQFFFRKIPHLGNPGGLDESAIPMACKVQNLLIADFLNYLALREQIYLSTMGDPLKKKYLSQPY